MYFNIVEYFVKSAIVFVFLFAQNSLLRLQFAFLNILYNHKPNARYFHPPFLQANANLKIILDWAFY